MKHFLTLIVLLVSNTLIAQQYSGNISGFKLDALDVVAFPFGMEYPLKIGSIDKEGHVEINLDAVDITKIPDDLKSDYFGRLTESFFSACNNPDVLGISNEIKAAKCGALFLWNNKEQAGALLLISDEKLKPWLEDRYYKEPVNASFFEILYVDQDINIDNTCKTTYNLESGDVVAENNFKIGLKKGFNMVQYKIDSIHKTNPEETSSIPVKMHILNPEDATEIHWIVKYF
ncbi:MAG: hypothetical protein ABI237_01575 [Ginsengibacter sp.]